MPAVDTNVLVRLATGDHAGQTVVADRFVAAGAWVSHLVIAETVWVLGSVYALRPQQIADAVRMFLDHPTLAVQEPDTVAAALVHFEARPALRFVDCLILEIARKAGHVPLGTFDRDFAKLPGTQRLAST
jgi:predicted nucleic-acid-binding protein